jgi:hypothetical protein
MVRALKKCLCQLLSYFYIYYCIPIFLFFSATYLSFPDLSILWIYAEEQ